MRHEALQAQYRVHKARTSTLPQFYIYQIVELGVKENQGMKLHFPSVVPG